MKLAGRIALVTGAQQGIGAAIAVALAGEAPTSRSPGLTRSRRPKGWQPASERPVAGSTSSVRMSRDLPTST
jgi:NAD(P)-dependent dehydrogenase (short-subunit alcohol dehydrogenase family)